MKKKKIQIESPEQEQRIACAKKTSIGGQALMEGIMMRGPKKSAMAVRNPQKEIVLEVTSISTKKPPIITKIPVARGVYNFIMSMAIGYKALMRSAQISGLDEIEEELAKEKAEKKAAKKAKKEAKLAAAKGETAKEVTESSESTDPKESEAAASEADGVNVAEESATTEELKQGEENAKSEKSEKSEEASKASANGKKDKKEGSSSLTTIITVISVVLGTALALGLFIFLPDLLSEGISYPLPNAKVWRPIFSGIIKIIILVAYMALVCLLKDIRRTFEYHGAEHKTIFCYEAGLPLTVENVRKQRRFHPRCGTSFLILMLIISIAIGLCINPVYLAITGVPAEGIIFTIIKLCLLPLTMGIGYELIKFAGRHDNILTRIISAPGMWLQRITVKEPSDDMIECAIAAFVAVVPEDQANVVANAQSITVIESDAKDSAEEQASETTEEPASEVTEEQTAEVADEQVPKATDEQNDNL